jgi:hypothetical protein
MKIRALTNMMCRREELELEDLRIDLEAIPRGSPLRRASGLRHGGEACALRSGPEPAQNRTPT